MEEKDRAWRRRQLDEAMAAMEDFARTCDDAATWYSRRASTESTRTRWLTLTASVVATIAGAGSLADFASRGQIGTIALVSAVLGTIATFYATNAAKVETHLSKADKLRQLAEDIHTWVRVDALDPHNKLEAVSMLRDFRERRLELEKGLPLSCQTRRKLSNCLPLFGSAFPFFIQRRSSRG